MCPGEKRKLTIPSSLGYGQRGAGNVIPGGKQLFDYFYKAKSFYIAKSLQNTNSLYLDDNIRCYSSV
jgi:hypothetical protein